MIHALLVKVSLDSALSYSYLKQLKGDERSADTPFDDKTALDALVKLSYKHASFSSYLSVAKKSRMPSMVEMFTFFPWEIPNPDLKPEQSMQYSLGMKYNFYKKNELKLDAYCEG